jgi:hypothetical protein
LPPPAVNPASQWRRPDTAEIQPPGASLTARPGCSIVKRSKIEFRPTQTNKCHRALIRARSR